MRLFSATKDAECIISIITWYGIGLCSYSFFTSYINVSIGLIIRTIFDYRLLPVLFAKFVCASDPVDHG